MMGVLMEDAQIKNALIQKNESVFDEVFRLYSGACLGLAKKILLNEARAQDVVQTVFVDLFIKTEKYDPTRGSLRTFLLTQTHSRSIDLIRSEKSRSAREKKQGEIANKDKELRIDSTEETIEKLELSQSMTEALNHLNENERKAIVLSYYNGHTYSEVAEILGEPQGTIKSRIRSALAKLRNNLHEIVPEGVQA